MGPVQGESGRGMNTSEIIFLFDYNYWATARVLSAASRVSAEQFTAPAGLSHGSLRGTLVHALGAEMVWRVRCQEGNSPDRLLQEADLSTFAALQARWREEERLMRAYLAGLSADDLQRSVRYRSVRGVEFEHTLWQILFHVVHHGTQTRAEAGVALTAFGQSPGDLDLILYVRDLGG